MVIAERRRASELKELAANCLPALGGLEKQLSPDIFIAGPSSESPCKLKLYFAINVKRYIYIIF